MKPTPGEWRFPPASLLYFTFSVTSFRFHGELYLIALFHKKGRDLLLFHKLATATVIIRNSKDIINRLGESVKPHETFNLSATHEFKVVNKVL